MRWNHSKADEVALAWLAGVSAGVLSERTGRTRDAIIGKLNRMGLLKTRKTKEPLEKRLREGPLRHHDRPEFRALYRAGYNDCEIARQTGFRSTAVWAWRKKHGLPKV